MPRTASAACDGGPVLASRQSPALQRLAGAPRNPDQPLLIRQHSTASNSDGLAPNLPVHSNRRRKRSAAQSEHRKIALSSFGDLEKQSAVHVKPSPASQLLVDRLEHQSDFRLWKELLHFRQRLYGDQGVKEIWKGIRQRSLQLPTKGDEAKELWTPFLAAAGEDGGLRSDILVYARELARDTGRRWSGFYAGFLEPLLLKSPHDAKTWEGHLRADGFILKGSLKDLMRPALSSTERLTTFKHLYKHHVDRDLYGLLIPALCKRQMIREALSFHYFFLGHHDLPNNTSEVGPLARLIAAFGDRSSFKRFRRSLAQIDRPLPAPIIRSAATKADELEFLHADEHMKRSGHSSRTPISDATAARAFATRAASVSLIITGLLAFNLQQLGILAMRELAARCATVEQLSTHLNRLKEKGVDFQESVYIRLMRRLASDRNQAVFESTLASDQHPEVYDDRRLQQRLLEQYVRERQWTDAHRTLTVLSVFYHKPPEQAWNIALRGFMVQKRWHDIDEVVKEMLQQKIMITEQTIKKSFHMLLPGRAPGKAPVPVQTIDGLDDLAFVTRIWVRILEAGGFVQTYGWGQILTSYGMLGRIEELECLSLKLADHYSSQARKLASQSFVANTLDPQRRRENEQTLRRLQRFRPKARHPNELLQIFTPMKQRAIIEWGFKTLGKQNSQTDVTSSGQLTLRNSGTALTAAPQTHPASQSTQWDRGLRLLAALRDRGLPVDNNMARSTIRQRLQVLFHPDYITSEPENRIARQTNRTSLAAMIQRANDLLGTNLFELPHWLLQGGSPQQQRLLERTVLGLLGNHGTSRSRVQMRRLPLHPEITIPTKPVETDRREDRGSGDSYRRFTPGNVVREEHLNS